MTSREEAFERSVGGFESLQDHPDVATAIHRGCVECGGPLILTDLGKPWEVWLCNDCGHALHESDVAPPASGETGGTR
jgi:hypothetical protein